MNRTLDSSEPTKRAPLITTYIKIKKIRVALKSLKKLQLPTLTGKKKRRDQRFLSKDEKNMNFFLTDGNPDGQTQSADDAQRIKTVITDPDATIVYFKKKGKRTWLCGTMLLV